MQLILPVAGLVFASIILHKSSDILVNTAIRLARILKISDFVVGFFILGLVTTSPEIFIGINSSLAGEPELSLGNLIGASIMLLTLIIGGNAVINGRVKFSENFTLLDMVLTALVIFFPALYLTDGTVNRWEGLSMLTAYLAFTAVMSRRHTVGESIRENLVHHHWKKALILMSIGIIGLSAGAKIVVESTEALAGILNIPLIMIGLVALAFGTNLPEISIMLSAIRKKHNQVGIGDFLGSAVTNTPVMGMIALIRPIKFSSTTNMDFNLLLLLLSLLAILALFHWGKQINRIQGILLICFFGLFLAAQFII